MDWKVKFSDCLTDKGNMKRSLSDAKKHEIYSYRVENGSTLKVLEPMTSSTKAVMIGCTACGKEWKTVGNIILKKSQCKFCNGTAKSVAKPSVKPSGVPLHLADRWPDHCMMDSVHPYERNRGSKSIDESTLYDDLFYILRNGGCCYFMTSKLSTFKNLINARLFMQSGTTSQKYVPENYNEHKVFTEYWRAVPFNIIWDNGIFKVHDFPIEYELIQTKYAPLLKYCLEKHFGNNGRLHYFDDTNFTETYLLRKEDYAWLQSLNTIDEIVDTVLALPLEKYGNK